MYGSEASFEVGYRDSSGRWLFSLIKPILDREDLKFISSLNNRDMLNFDTFFAVLRIPHIRREKFNFNY